MSATYENALECTNTALVVIFTIDLILKLIAYGVKQYFLGGSWNVFDFVVLMGSYIDIIMYMIIKKGLYIRLVKMFRAARLIKLLNYGGEMRTLLFVFLKALKSLPHVLFLIVLVFYIYAIIGMQVCHTISKNWKSAFEFLLPIILDLKMLISEIQIESCGVNMRDDLRCQQPGSHAGWIYLPT